MLKFLLSQPPQKTLSSQRLSIHSKRNILLKKRNHTSLHPQTRNYSQNVQQPQDNKLKKVLIANRGEIACRIMRTARRMGVRTVALYSDADRFSQHVKLADEAYYIGKSPSNMSYLRQDEIIRIAKEYNVDAIHPGYGFLSENEHFADSVLANGLIFIGPPSSAIRSMGSKSASKDIMIAANVPVVQGYHGEDQTVSLLKQEAEKIGYPVMIKAVMGGGGKGMRIARDADSFEEELEGAKAESRSSFGDDRVLIEKYLEQPRHVEVQVFADNFGDCVYLYERDCSVQRRHQKVIEEAPGPHISDELRAQIGQAAVDAAKAVNYRGAGTVEFIVDGDQFFFMEMNTRLQVEHPVTEMITNVDLVQWQLDIAANKQLPMKQEEIPLSGHSFEARIYAEDPYNNFMPNPGKLLYLQPPVANDTIRVETGVIQDDEVSVYYDPMIAKLVVWDENREAALKKLETCLENYHIAGLQTNIPFLLRITRNEEFKTGKITTNFIPKNFEELLPTKQITDDALLLIAIKKLVNEQLNNKQITNKSTWNLQSNLGFRVNSTYTRNLTFLFDGEQIVADVTYNNDSTFSVRIGDKQFNNLLVSVNDNQITVMIENNKKLTGEVVYLPQKKSYTAFVGGEQYVLNEQIPKYEESEGTAITAPASGSVVDVLVKVGDSVKKGQNLIIIESMKLNHIVKSPRDGVIKSVNCAKGSNLSDQAELIIFE